MAFFTMLGAKIPAPPFVTAPVFYDAFDEIKGTLTLTFTKLKYGTCSKLLKTECESLRQFVGRNQQKLRSEKAMQFTKELKNLTNRFPDSNFQFKLMNFKNTFPSTKTASSGPQVKVPSYQWLKWLIHVLQREAALLAKIKRECEQAMDFWLALISASRHFRDSSLISSIISRIWYLSSVMVEELDTKIYPFLFKLTNILKPEAGSRPWPDSGQRWELPRDGLTDWLQKNFNLPFEPAYANPRLSSIVEKDNRWILRAVEEVDDSIELNSGTGERFQNSLTDFVKTESPVPSCSGMKTESQKSAVSQKRLLDDNDTSDSDEEEDRNPAKKFKPGIKLTKAQKKKLPDQIKKLPHFRLYWNKLFIPYEVALTTTAGREEMLRRIESYKSPPANLFTDHYWKLYEEFKPHIMSYESAVRSYDPNHPNAPNSNGRSLTHDQLLARFQEIQVNIRAQLDNLNTKTKPGPAKKAQNTRFH